MKSARSINNITEGVIWKQLLVFFFPIILGSFFQQLYNTVDAVVVGRYVGKEALAAVGGSTGTIINLLIGIFNGVASGATVIISQHYGAGKLDSTKKAISTALALALAGGAVLTVLGLSLSRFALTAIGTPKEALEMALTYIRIFFGGITFSLIYNVGAGVIRAMGDSKRPLYFLIAGCILNIIADIIFVVVLDMGVAGAAVATVLSQAFCATLEVIYLVRGSVQLKLRTLGFELSMTRDIARIGIPIAMQSVLYSVSNIIIQSGINSFGTDAAAAWTAYGKIDSFFWMMINAFGVSITTFAGQNFGARKYDRVKKSVKTCLVMSFAATVLVTALVILAGRPMLQLFTDDTSVLAIGVHMVNTLSPFFVLYICIEVLSGAMRGCGDTLVPTVFTVVGVCLLRAIWVLVLVPMNPSITMVEFSYPVTWGITSVMFIIYYLFGGWLERCRVRSGHNAE